MSWRDEARPVIARVLSENAGKPNAEGRKALRDAYPFGERRYHPYKVWLDEIARQTGRKVATVRSGPAKRPHPDVVGQATMFPDGVKEKCK